jgi:glycosyltransferase involved in cell wall biosynthesis
MALLGLAPEPPFDPFSWSGSSAHFFRAMRDQDLLADAREVTISRVRDGLEKALTLSFPIPRWKARYHASVRRFTALTAAAGQIISGQPEVRGVLQIGAWFSSGRTTKLPCFSYHDGNAALRYRYYGRGLLTEGARRAHLNWERSVYEALTGIFVMSQWLADSFAEDFGVPRSKLHVVGGAINMALPERVPERAWSAPRYLFVGKDFERKGGKYLLEAFGLVRKAIPEAELVVVGPTVQIRQTGVVSAGYLSKAKPEDTARLAELFSSATATVLPSIYEPFGISLLEGMAYGLPCVAVNRCAMPEIVRHGETGLIARAENAGSLANAMIELGKNPDEAHRMGIAGRRRIESDYTWNAVVTKIKAVLSDSYGM